MEAEVSGADSAWRRAKGGNLFINYIGGSWRRTSGQKVFGCLRSILLLSTNACASTEVTVSLETMSFQKISFGRTENCQILLFPLHFPLEKTLWRGRSKQPMTALPGAKYSSTSSRRVRILYSNVVRKAKLLLCSLSGGPWGWTSDTRMSRKELYMRCWQHYPSLYWPQVTAGNDGQARPLLKLHRSTCHRRL